MSDASEMLKEWADAVGEVRATQPTIFVPTQTRDLRIALLKEEYHEYKRAAKHDDLIEIADGLGDCMYIIYGTAAVYGIPLDEVFAEIHRSNMTKLIGGVQYRLDGKIMKGAAYERPDIARVLGINQ